MNNHVEIVKKVATNPSTPWVLFNNGTVAFMPGVTEKLEEAAKQLLADWGPVQAGTPSGDFRVISIDDGWFVGCHHPDILTLVTTDELESNPADPAVGLHGRSKRAQDAEELAVVHVQKAIASSTALSDEPEIELSESPKLAEAQRVLLSGDVRPLTEHLMAGGHWMSMEPDRSGANVYRQEHLPVFLPDPWPSLFRSKVGGEYLTLNGPRGFEVRSKGAFYSLTTEPVPDYRLPVIVTGVENTGRMTGAAAQAVMAEFGTKVQQQAQAALAETDRSLGRVVFTEPEPHQWLAHVVSTPKHTPESPGWLTKAVPGVLDGVAELGVQHLVFVALGTNGGISEDDCARLMLSECERWFRENDVPMQVVFSLTDRTIYEQFKTEFRKRKLFFTEL